MALSETVTIDRRKEARNLQKKEASTADSASAPG